MSLMQKDYEAPHLSNAIRQFGGITQNFEITSIDQVISYLFDCEILVACLVCFIDNIFECKCNTVYVICSFFIIYYFKCLITINKF